jgi:lipopolysaccharide/colanic/teichoic acid biosynthesis glycosyltransferase
MLEEVPAMLTVMLLMDIDTGGEVFFLEERCFLEERGAVSTEL